MSNSMKSGLRRSLAMGAFGIFASAVVFAVGAHVGTSLEHHTKSVSVAKIPVQNLQAIAQK